MENGPLAYRSMPANFRPPLQSWRPPSSHNSSQWLLLARYPLSKSALIDFVVRIDELGWYDESKKWWWIGLHLGRGLEVSAQIK